MVHFYIHFRHTEALTTGHFYSFGPHWLRRYVDGSYKCWQKLIFFKTPDSNHVCDIFYSLFTTAVPVQKARFYLFTWLVRGHEFSGTKSGNLIIFYIWFSFLAHLFSLCKKDVNHRLARHCTNWYFDKSFGKWKNLSISSIILCDLSEGKRVRVT